MFRFVLCCCIVTGVADLRHDPVRLRADRAPTSLQLLHVHRVGGLPEPREPAPRGRRGGGPSGGVLGLQ